MCHWEKNKSIRVRVMSCTNSHQNTFFFICHKILLTIVYKILQICTNARLSTDWQHLTGTLVSVTLDLANRVITQINKFCYLGLYFRSEHSPGFSPKKLGKNIESHRG